MSDKICPCCNQTLPPPLDLEIKLRPSQWRVVELVLAAGYWGISSERLYRQLYNDPIKGEPITGMKALHARIWSVNKTLAEANMRIVANHPGAGYFGHYKLVNWYKQLEFENIGGNIEQASGSQGRAGGRQTNQVGA